MTEPSRLECVRGFAGALALSAACASPLGCSSEAPPRPQLVVIVDTDAPVLGVLRVHPELSPDAAVDTVRIDVLTAAGGVFDFRDFVASDPLDWPISFGVPSAAPGITHLRIRAFRGGLASPGMVNGKATLEPPPEVTIERLVDVPAPASGISRVRVLLTEDCIGRASTFLHPWRTCLDAARTSVDPAEGVLPIEAVPATSAVGTWPGAREVPCAAPGTNDAVCVPGGYTVLGEQSVAGYDDGLNLEAAVPLHPVRLSPFYLDKTEYTVKRLRLLVQQNKYTDSFPTQRDPKSDDLQFCTWLGADIDTNDDRPVNCIDWSAANHICEVENGSLPTEAQWEHAARGRGQRRLYPWGDAGSTCCASSLSRIGALNAQGMPSPAVECGPAGGIEPVGSHPRSQKCEGLGDVSRDGVLDLAGSLSEATLDSFRSLAHPCWNIPGAPVDPRCFVQGQGSRVSRGGYWNAGLFDAFAALRHSFTERSPTAGFRCAYRSPPQ